ncbi:AGAP004937PAlike, partial [Caligus rogercresseyi]
VAKRPDRLLSRIKSLNVDDKEKGGIKVVAIRQPKVPDGSKGFKSRSTMAAMALLEKMESKGGGAGAVSANG